MWAARTLQIRQPSPPGQRWVLVPIHWWMLPQGPILSPVRLQIRQVLPSLVLPGQRLVLTLVHW
jgi:hypothetical protein